ncbi:RrF2 family transcriptional regulator [Jeotgalicoccus meleagridis]|jgi:Rrf2 family cysteine metabolism transcriptional repressor|uniref:HTH-type transcriptional regulator CymR n=1 Tax=Jeotgalicoccus meleagridis TaxID=2759181 RepID=A0A6V7RKY4_9STAP|nr:Rrf2 family transcriptional regulator [Jeotgalicoccus meleagridis]CAD2078497.1 HTH-type transcriptional regulator CymR [Jeotgalicoccus meleagridis]
MKISTKGRYGLYFMLSLARDYGVKKRSVKSVATERNISDLYLEQIVANLKKDGLVKSTRGAYGGYELNHPPDEITVGQIFAAVEESIIVVDTDDHESKNESYLWKRIKDAVNDVLDHTSIHDIIDNDTDDFDGYMFYI